MKEEFNYLLLQHSCKSKMLGFLYMLLLLFSANIPLGAQINVDQAQKLLDERTGQLLFERNDGQYESGINYVAKDNQATYAFLEGGEVNISMVNAAGDKMTYLQLNFLNTKEKNKVMGRGRGINRQTGNLNYIGGDGGEIKNVVFNKELLYQSLWNGINAKFYGSEQGMKYDFIVQPGANPNDIKYEIQGAQNLSVNADGELVYTTPFGELRKGKPYTYQLIDGEEVEVACAYQLTNGVISFQIGDYNPARPLIIDPVALKYAIFLGEGDGEFLAKDVFYKDDKLYLGGWVKGNAIPLGYTATTNLQFGVPGSLIDIR